MCPGLAFRWVKEVGTFLRGFPLIPVLTPAASPLFLGKVDMVSVLPTRGRRTQVGGGLFNLWLQGVGRENGGEVGI